jgi:KaiC/GvpD/RAD55 family RecA-like ATPase
MDYRLEVEDTPDTIAGGTGVVLVHPSTGETDRIDTDFLKTDTDSFLVISTRTTAREVEQKLEHYDVDRSRATILDALSVERGYSRRSGEGIHYVSSPDDLEGIVDVTREFLDEHDGKLRVSVDSVTEMAYYADEERTKEAVTEILSLLRNHDAVGLFHLAEEVHTEEVLKGYRELFDGTITLEEDNGVRGDF